MPCRATDELGYVPLSKTDAELLFELISQRYECGSTLITSNLPSDEWTQTFGSERLTGALLDRLTHHVNILLASRPTRLGTCLQHEGITPQGEASCGLRLLRPNGRLLRRR